MGIFSKLKHAFGFGGNEFEDEEDTFGIDATVQSLSRNNDNDAGSSADRQAVPDSLTEAGDSAAEEAEPEVPLDSIFQTVVEEFNRAMPEFIGTGANADAQRRHLYDALDADVRKLLESLHSDAAERCSRRWERERRSLNNDVNAMKERLKTVGENEADKNKQLLSAERQKRALTERVHDLEAQIANLEAEKDQYELETRSLVNKLRVSNMVNEGVEIPDVTTYETRIEELNARIGELTAGIEEQTARNTSLEEEKKEVESQLSALKVKVEMSDVMINDLNKRASGALCSLKERDAEVEEYKKKLDQAVAERATVESQLNEALTNLGMAASIQSEVERIQETISKKNNKISELNTELRRRDDRINALEAEEASLRKTIESNLMQQAESEKSLRDEIARLEQQLSSTGGKEKPRAKRKPVTKISAIDEDLDNTDWLVATPPEGTSAKTSGVSDSEFGYQEPQRKNPPENSAQMSLW